MKIIIIRHEKVDMEWAAKYNSASFQADCDKYDRCSVVKDPVQTIDVDADKYSIYISELIRTYETACKLFGRKDFIKTELLNEVPMRPYKDSDRQIRRQIWNLFGRLQWLWQNRHQPEVRCDSEKRADALIDMLENKGNDCYLVTHGFYMRTIVKMLKKRGYSISRANKLGIGNLDQITAMK